MKPFHLAAAVLFASTTMAMAQEKVQISYSGVVSVGHYSLSNSSTDYFYGNGDVGFRWSTVNDLKFGADLGIETFHKLDDVSYHITSYYAAGVVEGRFGKISIGMPRGIMDDYFTVPALGGSEALDHYSEFTLFTSTDLIGIFKLIGGEEEELYGARYDGKIGQIEVSASAFRSSDSSVHIEEIAARYDAGQWSVSLGTVLLEDNGGSANSTSLEVQGHAGKFSGGMVYTKSDPIGNIDSIRGFVSYDVNEMIKLNTQVIHVTTEATASDWNIYSFDLEYTNKTGAFINAGIIKSDLSDGNFFDVSLGYKF